jgi:hypothetical protein
MAQYFLGSLTIHPTTRAPSLMWGGPDSDEVAWLRLREVWPFALN